jgi:hypothetical protein
MCAVTSFGEAEGNMLVGTSMKAALPAGRAVSFISEVNVSAKAGKQPLSASEKLDDSVTVSPGLAVGGVAVK